MKIHGNFYFYIYRFNNCYIYNVIRRNTYGQKYKG